MNEQLMTKDEFIAYAWDVLFGDGVECLYEQIAEYEGEVAMFGDAGPGMGYRLHQSVAFYNSVGRQYERLTGYTVRRLSVRSPR